MFGYNVQALLTLSVICEEKVHIKKFVRMELCIFLNYKKKMCTINIGLRIHPFSLSISQLS